jgi:type III restriction enzyme
LINFGYKDYREVVPPALVPKLVFRGFEKACHFEYKFDSKTELDLTFVLETDANVLKWLRPAPNQFRMYWDNNSKKYEPDFVVETNDAIYMVETKASNELNNDDVLQKTAAALTYCKNATEFTSQNGGKPWQYLLIPHTTVSKTVSFNFLIGNYRIV